jgi:hypothetical protein
MNVQEKNAAYRNAYAEMAARLGDSDAQRLQQSNQYGWEAIGAYLLAAYIFGITGFSLRQ